MLKFIIGSPAILFLTVAMSLSAHAALLPPGFIDGVVALGSNQNTAPPGQPPKFQWITEGTGFFYGHPTTNDPDITKRQYRTYLVTAAHVVTDHPANLGPLHIRVNPKDNAGQELDLPILGSANWFSLPNVDVAVVPINYSLLKDTQARFYQSDTDSDNIDKLKSAGVAAGDGVYLLGFPMNLAGAQRNYVIVRNGIIARLSEMLDNASATYMIDAFAFPGNSGGPVILRPEASAIQGTQQQLNARLIGMVLSYQPYVDTAVSIQTHHARVAFEENSGLAEVIPIDSVDATIQAVETKANVKSTIPFH